MADMDLQQREVYQFWFAELKNRIRVSQLKAAVRVNTELILVYWQLGKEIVEKQQEANWGESLIEQLSLYFYTGQKRGVKQKKVN